MVLKLKFNGFFECRLATDPDHYEEKRGISGWTFATEDEPDLDRIIRFQPNNAIQRRPGPLPAVSVVSVVISGQDAVNHVLVGARVLLIGNPVFEGRNGEIAPSASEPIFPFEIAVMKGNLSLRRAMRNPANDNPLLIRSSGGSVKPDLLQEAGITDTSAYREARIHAIEDRLGDETDAAVVAGLEKRLLHLNRPNNSGALMWGPVPAGYFVDYDYTLSHPDGVIFDPDGVMDPIDVEREWKFRGSFGAWDADALSGYCSCTLELPMKDLAVG